MSANAEQKLAKQVSERDPAAMKALYDQYAGYLTAVCSRYIDSKEDVKDLMQESFIRIFSGIRSFEFRGEGSLKAWMGRIVTNTALKHMKEAANKGTVTLDDNIPVPDEPQDTEFPDMSDMPPSVIQDMIRNLPPGYRTVFNLFVFEDMSHQEISRILGIKENSSASQLHRAKSLLARQVTEYRKNH